MLRVFGYAPAVGLPEECARNFRIIESSGIPRDLKHAPYSIEKLATDVSQTESDTREKACFKCARHNERLYGARLAEEQSRLTERQSLSPRKRESARTAEQPREFGSWTTIFGQGEAIYAAGVLYDEQSSCLEQDDYRLYEMRAGWNNGIEPLIRQLEIDRNIRAW
ncbi:hypothetical protein FRC12_012058 [Ceratobasidium sp. 428]|nr:hypothetical protein FRC12_012058 [Ceratobasidium sp. 428]